MREKLSLIMFSPRLHTTLFLICRGRNMRNLVYVFLEKVHCREFKYSINNGLKSLRLPFQENSSDIAILFLLRSINKLHSYSLKWISVNILISISISNLKIHRAYIYIKILLQYRPSFFVINQSKLGSFGIPF